MKKFLVSIVILAIFISLYFFSKNTQKEVTIGFVGSLSGKYSVLGNAMVNGVVLAFEQKSFVVGDKKINLVFKDDKNNPAINKQIIEEYIEKDVKIIIGNVTSSMTKISRPLINKHEDMILISASSASNEFSNKDDQFFRVHVANDMKRFDSFSKYLLKNDLKKVYGIYDPYNKTYAKDYLINFEKSFVKNGGEKFIRYMTTNVDLNLLSQDIKREKPDVVLICANSVDAARVVQYIKLKNVDTRIASSEWAMTPSFLENSGKNAYGTIFNIDYDQNSQEEDYIKFTQKYEKNYGSKPNIYASKAYELATVLIKTLELGDETEVKQNILKTKKFKGLQDYIIFNQYGDVERNFYTFEVDKNGYVRVE